jgi:all-trans-8'-apo-beta-carotenal 15,15'-oxygenase
MQCLFRNGPGNFLIGEKEILHPFDGDGMITSIRIHNKKGYFKNRFVQTIDFKKEQATKKVSKRGAFRTLKPGGIFTNLFDPKVKNVANTNIIYWNKKLMAMWEGGKPYFLDAKTLETLSVDEEDLNQQLFPTETFTAHPKIDPFTNTLIAFGTQSELSSTKIRVFELNQENEMIFQR